MKREERIRAGLWSLILGDSIGVPVEFMSRQEISLDPVKELRANGTHNQPEGTWSDDSSLTLCSVENIIEGPNLDALMTKFSSWLENGLWTPGGVAFDVGIATREAIQNFQKGEPAILCGGIDEWSNGNGSLMRVLPFSYYYAPRPESERRTEIFKVSAVTHGHSRSKLACWFYSEIIRNLLNGLPKVESIDTARATVDSWTTANDPDMEWQHFRRCSSEIEDADLSSIKSTGYVVDTLEAALFSFLNTESPLEALYFATNLGSDTDTVAAVTGGLAGTFYGLDSQGASLLPRVRRFDDINVLIEAFVDRSAKF